MFTELLQSKGYGNSTIVDFRVTKTSPTFTNKADLIEEIIYQKRVEFWGEGLEYIDNRRLNIPVDRTDETWGAENNNHFSAGKFRYNQEERPFLYQLPLSEIENNSQLSPTDQN